MVNLTPRQTAILKDLNAAKVQFDRDSVAFDAWLAQQAAGRKARIAELVREAEREKVPQARIYNTLGFDQPAPYQRFIRPGLEFTAGGGTLGSGYVPTTPAPFEAERPKVGDFTITAGDMDEADPWFVTDEYGKKYAFHYLIGHGTPDAPHLFNQSELDELPKEYWQELTTAIEAAWGSIAWE